MSNPFAKTICSICYEDLKPIVEDLQVISICGHVFHELCLQQWFGYCSGRKKCTCPVCKQSCKAANVSRLYFQSLGDPADHCASQCEEKQADPKLLGGEIVRLEAKVQGLNSTVDCQGKEIQRLNGELYDCNEQLKAELLLKNEVVKQKASVQEMLRFKSQELDLLKKDHLKLQDKSMALAKELAALKLASDLNLEEDEVLKLASFGNEANAKDTIDILRKSLVSRNKSYQELLAKCNQLGRGEARSSKNLEKAKEKIIRLKTRIQELVTAVELKENQALRLLKTSKDTNSMKKIPGGLGDNLDTPISGIFRPGNDKERVSSTSLDCLVRTASPIGDARVPFSINDHGSNFTDEPSRNQAYDKQRNNCIIIDEGDQDLDLDHPTGKQQTKEQPVDNAGSGTDRSKDTASPAAAAQEASFSIGGNVDVWPALNIRKELPSSVSFSKPDICFSSGLLGPDGTTRYLGKWCKRDQSKQLAGQKPSTNSGDLIAVGADGRGGRVKVLRPLNQALMSTAFGLQFLGHFNNDINKLILTLSPERNVVIRAYLFSMLVFGWIREFHARKKVQVRNQNDYFAVSGMFADRTLFWEGQAVVRLKETKIKILAPNLGFLLFVDHVLPGCCHHSRMIKLLMQCMTVSVLLPCSRRPISNRRLVTVAAGSSKHILWSVKIPVCLGNEC